MFHMDQMGVIYCWPIQCEDLHNIKLQVNKLLQALYVVGGRDGHVAYCASQCVVHIVPTIPRSHIYKSSRSNVPLY